MLVASGSVLAACGNDDELISNATTARDGAAEASREDTYPPAKGFRDTTGVTDIPAFGVEASVEERAEAQAALSGYLQAFRAGEWARACGRFAPATALQLRQLVAQVEGVSRKSCAEALRLLSATPPTGPSPYVSRAPIAALRIKRGGTAKEGAGFALFHGDDGNDYWITMRLEGGRWKVTAALPQELR